MTERKQQILVNYKRESMMENIRRADAQPTPSGERHCTVGVDSNSEPIFEQFVRLAWHKEQLAAKTAELEAERAAHALIERAHQDYLAAERTAREHAERQVTSERATLNNLRVCLEAAEQRLAAVEAQLAGVVEQVNVAIACLDRAQEPILNRPVSVAHEIEYAIRALRALAIPAAPKAEPVVSDGRVPIAHVIDDVPYRVEGIRPDGTFIYASPQAALAIPAAPKAETASGESSAGGFTLGEQSTAWASTVVVCDWANTRAEQEVLREITWQFEHLRNLVGVPLSVKVSKRDAAAPQAPDEKEHK